MVGGGADKGVDPGERVDEFSRQFWAGGTYTFPNGRIVTFNATDIIRMAQFEASRRRRTRPKAVHRPEDFMLRRTTGEPQ